MGLGLRWEQQRGLLWRTFRLAASELVPLPQCLPVFSGCLFPSSHPLPEPHSRFWSEVLLVFHLSNLMELSRTCFPVSHRSLFSFSSGLSSLLPFFPPSLLGVWH